MRTIEEIAGIRRVFSAHVKGATPPRGWFLKCISGDEKYRISRGEWIARFLDHGENGCDFTVGPDMSFGVYWKTEAEATDASDKLKRVGMETEVVKVG